MAICTTCTHSTPYLYTVYESDYNLRLEQCSNCHAFVDPYVEYDTLTLVLDLILLKRGVYRHLLYNQGTEPRRLVGKNGSTTPASTSDVNVSRNEEDGDYLFQWDLREQRWILILRLGVPLVLIDAFIRWSYLTPDKPFYVSPWTTETLRNFFRVLLGCCAETLAFHSGVMLSCYTILRCIRWLYLWRQTKLHRVPSDIRREFRLSLIPLSLFYSSLIKLFLLFLLTIWLPASTSSTSRHTPVPHIWNGLSVHTRISPYILKVLESFDDDNIDQEWIVRNVLGGMSAGFGLRVILDLHPVLMTIIILVGWALKTATARLVSEWVGSGVEGLWLKYSLS